ncbi:MAG: hemolysin family protein [Treponema sp.]|nr:hemolysin family protein [Treponema sp.]
MVLFRFGKSKDEDAHSNSPAGSVDDGPSSDRAKEDEALNEEKRDMIRGIEDLSETTVKEVMIPRIDVDFLSIETPQDELMEKIAASGHSRFPVYSESIDNVVGVLYVKDLINAFSRHENFDLEKIIRKAYFIPESKKIDTLLREFKRRHIHIAIAIDEYGGVSGIVCMEDIIEEIVGDIQDEFDNEREDIISIGENIWLCDARVDLDDLNETIASSFPTEDFDTLGGFVFDLFGKIPVKYEKISWNDFDFIVQDMEGHRINVIKVIRKISADDNIIDGGK